VSAALGVSSTGISGIKDAGYTVVESTSSVDSTHKNKKYWWDHLVDGDSVKDKVADELILGSGLDGEEEEYRREAADDAAERAAEEDAVSGDGSKSIISLLPDDYELSESM